LVAAALERKPEQVELLEVVSPATEDAASVG
jgi:hypothetical protein